MLKKIFTAITALALVATLLAGTAGPAAAASGYDSAYFGESAFLTLAPGASGQFAVGFNNTGSTGWLVGSSSQVDLTVCLADKLTCNVTSPNAAFASSWLSSTAYATTSTTYVGPGQTGFFVYNITAPAAAAAGTYRFNGDLALHNTASMIHQQGYYQDSDVASLVAAPTITSLTPNSGTSAGGTAVTVAGTGFVCTPATPTVMFGTAAGTVTSCGATSITVTSPAHAVGVVSVTVNNAGGAASNGLDYTYADLTAPTFNSVTAIGNTLTLTFSEAVCKVIATAFAATDYFITVNGVPDAATGDNLANCDSATAATNGVTSYIVTVATAFNNGDTVSVTLTALGAAKVQDAAGNASSAQTRTATATADTTKPSISTAAATSTTTIKLTYTQAVRCTTAGGTLTQFSITSSTGTPAAQNPTSTTCSTSLTGSTTITLTFANAVSTSGTVIYTAGLVPVQDLVGNTATSPQTVSFNAFVADTTRPLSEDIRVKTSAGLSATLDTGDVFTVAFNEVMLAPTTGAKIRLTDADGTVADVTCGTNATCTLSGADTTIGGVVYPSGQVITVTMTADPTIVTAGTIAGLAIPATVIDSGGITDTSANTWDIVNSPDKTLN
ncbi:MAG TPA: hypothetical protein DCK98_13255 [Chloroflexi bacterium]|jgi:hypothetical protein|nr:hypothetical protein [Chloroflexota bacterium]HAL26177.1 hypothetical protein [Chloroflexota bacterium]